MELLVLVDRGHRELPIQADYIGRSVDTRPQEQVDVLLEERDGRDEVLLTAKTDLQGHPPDAPFFHAGPAPALPACPLFFPEST